MEDSNIKIIKAGLEELDILVHLFDNYRIFYHQESDRMGARQFLRERLENGESVIFLAFEEKDGRIQPLGFTQLYPSFSSVSMKRLWILNDLYVDEMARKKGIAKKLMNRAKEYAQETGAIGITLQTAFDNLNAQRLYESLGYSKDENFFTYNLKL